MPNKPTQKQEAFADAKLSGMNDAEARRAAGYSNRTLNVNQYNNPVLTEARLALAKATNLRKSDVLEGIINAIQRAQMMGEPSTEIKGWSEVAKMLGYYAPETKRIDINIEQGRLKQKFEQLSDEELLQIAKKPAIEGDYERLN